MKIRRNIALTIFLIAASVLVSFSVQDEAEPWEVPEEYKTMENPESPNKSDLAYAKTLYNKNCALCHGKTGLGDGTMARGLENFNVDFTVDQFQSQSDGEHFYKIKTGRNTMPSYARQMSEEDIWIIVSYIRTLSK